MSDANPLFDKFGMVVDSGKIIFEENQVGDRMYIIQEGSVRISKMIDGKSHIFAVLGKGEFFGEMAIVNQVKRTATATAAGTIRLLSFDRTGFVSMVSNNARIALSIIDKLCRRLQAANAQIQHLVRRNEKGLVVLNLYYAFAEHGMEQAHLEIHKTSREISLSLELPQEKVIEYIHELQEAGVIEYREGILELANGATLIAMAESAGATGERG
ncbi:MAG: Crp/Fnr family transcriptional regulator [Spirochaetales bacterium]|nr:Crp/Fnr family transcriptional regulator [Spirochaetales bacterium]